MGWGAAIEQVGRRRPGRRRCSEARVWPEIPHQLVHRRRVVREPAGALLRPSAGHQAHVRHQPPRLGSPITTPEEGGSSAEEIQDGLSRPWTTWSTQDAGGLVVFAGAMVKTWQGWVDNEALRMPGYRDRVVTILTPPTRAV